MNVPLRPGIPRRDRRGFTLIEALMASGILLGVVLAVTSAVTAGQQGAYEAQQRIAANLAGEELMGRLLAEPYAALPGWDGHTEAVGAMTDMFDQPMPPSYDGVGRSVAVRTLLSDLPGLDVKVRGREITVRVFDADARGLAVMVRFVPEPQP